MAWISSTLVEGPGVQINKEWIRVADLPSFVQLVLDGVELYRCDNPMYYSPMGLEKKQIMCPKALTLYESIESIERGVWYYG